MALRLFLLVLLAGVWPIAALGQEAEYLTLDRMFVKPDVPLHAVVGRGEVGLLAYHSYPMPLHHFRVIAKGENLDVTVDPAPMAEFKPTTIERFALHIVVKGRPASDRVPLSVGVAADELKSEKQFTITVPLTKKAERDVNEALMLPVGEIELYVRRFGEEIYYLYVIPILLMLGWLFWRKRSAAQVRTED